MLIKRRTLQGWGFGGDTTVTMFNPLIEWRDGTSVMCIDSEADPSNVNQRHLASRLDKPPVKCVDSTAAKGDNREHEEPLFRDGLFAFRSTCRDSFLS